MNIPIFVYKLQGYVLGCIYFILRVVYKNFILIVVYKNSVYKTVWRRLPLAVNFQVSDLPQIGKVLGH